MFQWQLESLTGCHRRRDSHTLVISTITLNNDFKLHRIRIVPSVINVQPDTSNLSSDPSTCISDRSDSTVNCPKLLYGKEDKNLGITDPGTHRHLSSNSPDTYSRDHCPSRICLYKCLKILIEYIYDIEIMF